MPRWRMSAGMFYLQNFFRVFLSWVFALMSYSSNVFLILQTDQRSLELGLPDVFNIDFYLFYGLFNKLHDK